jgi:hypothetical protein
MSPISAIAQFFQIKSVALKKFQHPDILGSNFKLAAKHILFDSIFESRKYK